ncbi:MAG TPA: P63C domain-containing protein, partial [Opitutus sp.]|nr:P63C domain-containing protein [Opitutus sp.]
MGKLPLCGHEIPCANLEDGRRVISITAFSAALGRSSPGAQTYRRRAEQGVDHLPIFLSSKRLSPFIPSDFSVSTIRYTPVGNGAMAEGIDAQAVPMICGIWVKAWAADALVAHQIPTAQKAAAIATALAHVGIAALVDEATGFQYDRDREALSVILEQYLGKELAAWTKTFPDDFYRHLSKLRGIRYDDQKRPQYFGMLTNDIIYSRLAPGVRKELCTRNPKLDSGRRRFKHHQF